MRRLEMYLTDEQIVSLLSNNIKIVVTNEISARRRLVTFDSQEQFNKAFEMLR